MKDIIAKETSILGIVNKVRSFFTLDTDELEKASSKKHAVECFILGFIQCEKCGTFMNLNDVTPLEMFQCNLCHTPAFAPMKVGTFWLFEPLGGGGMGSVYKAYHVKYRDDVFAA